MAQTSNWWFSGFPTEKASTTKAGARVADTCQESGVALTEVVASRGACSASESTSSTKTARTETDQQMLSGSSFGPSHGDDTDSAAKVDDADFMVVRPSACPESEQDFAARIAQRELEPTIASLPLNHHTRDGMHPLSSHGDCLKFVPPTEQTVETQTSSAGAAIQQENGAIAQAPQLPSNPAPTLHCSEFMKALIEKQHEVERFFPLQPHDIHPNIITKMSMVKNELDLLSSSISGILMKSASAVASPSSHMHHGTFDGAHHQAFASSLQPQDLQRLQNYSGQNTDALQNQQAWPAMDVDVAQYAVESEMVDGGVGVSQYQQNGLVDEPAPQMHAPTSTSQYEDNQGPAVFRGFNAPPSFAWGRPLVETRGDDASTHKDRQQQACPETPGSASAVAATLGVPAEAPVHLARPKSIDMSSPLRGGSCESSMKLAFTAAMEELQRCQSSCASLREESRGVPVAEVETWCSSLGRHLEQMVDKLQEKLETHRKKSRAKDEAIKRLFKQLQDQRCASEIGIPPQGAPGSAQRSSSTEARRDLLPESSPPDASGSLERREDSLGNAGSTPVKESKDANVVIDCFGDQDERDAHAEVDGGEDVLHLATPLTLHPEVSPAPGVHRNVHASLVSDDKRAAVVPRSHRATDVGSQKSLNRQPAEKTQQVHLQRELAQLRRRDNDLEVQLRMRETEVGQLTDALNELQAVTQRQIRLYKRQLDLKDNSLQALHEKRSGHPPSAAAIPSTAQSASCSHAGNPAGSDTGNIRETGGRPPSLSDVAQVAVGARSPVPGAGVGSVGIASASGSLSLAHAAMQEQRRRGRGGATPRASDGDRRRANVTWLAKKEPRDRSLGALPHSPLTKHRDVASHAHTQFAAEVSLRRRTSQPEIGSFGRSPSADDPNRRKVPKRTQPNYDADPGVIGKSTRHRDGAGFARQRR